MVCFPFQIHRWLMLSTKRYSAQRPKGTQKPKTKNNNVVKQRKPKKKKRTKVSNEKHVALTGAVVMIKCISVCVRMYVITSGLMAESGSQITFFVSLYARFKQQFFQYRFSFLFFIRCSHLVSNFCRLPVFLSARLCKQHVVMIAIMVTSSALWSYCFIGHYCAKQKINFPSARTILRVAENEGNRNTRFYSDQSRSFSQHWTHIFHWDLTKYACGDCTIIWVKLYQTISFANAINTNSFVSAFCFCCCGPQISPLQLMHLQAIFSH